MSTKSSFFVYPSRRLGISSRQRRVYHQGRQDGDDVIPVKLEVKEFLDKNNSLYVTITLGNIKRDEVIMEGNTENGVTQATRSSIISISQLLSKINPQDESFLKYIPDGFLDSERLQIKRDAIEKDRKADEERNAGKNAPAVQQQNRRTVGESDRAVLSSALMDGAVTSERITIF